MNSIWTLLQRIVIVLLVTASLLLVALWYWPLIRTNAALRRRLNDVQMQVELERQQVAQKSNLVQSLTSDDHMLERLAREKLGWARPGETVILFQASPAPAVPP
jgi:cell division protein FtsB